jgi:ankyrin repeat protein
MEIANLETLIEADNLQGIKDLLIQQPTIATAVTSHGISPLLLACYYKKQHIANIIAEFLDNLTIYEACAIGKFDVASHLIFQNPACINTYSADGFTPLGLAVFFQHEDLARFLVLKGADVNMASKNGFNVFPIHSAVANSNYNIAKILLDNGAYPNVCQRAGVAPLHTAAQLGNIEIIILLLEHGAEVGLKMEGDKIPADLAAEKGFLEIAKILRED